MVAVNCASASDAGSLELDSDLLDVVAVFASKGQGNVVVRHNSLPLHIPVETGHL